MRKSIFFFATFFALNCFAADIPVIPNADIKESQLDLLDNLIKVTASNLDIQKELRKRVEGYLKIQTQYLKNPQDKDLTLKMVKEAHFLIEMIKEGHLTQAFAPEFISELTFFSQIANKRGIPQP